MTTRLIADVTDVAAGAVGLAALVKWLPPIAAAFTILWVIIRIFEWARVAIWRMPKR